MIGVKRFCLETKKPVCETGTFWAIARSNSYLLDNHSIYDTGGMCKDSLLISQQGFFGISAEHLTGLSLVRVLEGQIMLSHRGGRHV